MGSSLWCSKAESAVEQPLASSFTEWPDWSDYQTRPCPAMRSQYHFLTHFAMHHYMLEDVCLETGNHCNAVRLHNTFRSVPTTVSCKFQNEQSMKPINCSRSAAFSPTSTNFMPSSCHSFGSSCWISFPASAIYVVLSYWLILRKSERALATLTLLPSSLPPCGSSRRSLGAVSPAMTGRTGPSELRHLGAPSLARWMAGSDQSDVEPLHQERRP